MSNSDKPLELKIKCETEDEMKQRFIRCILGTSNVNLTDKEFDILFAFVKHCNGTLTADNRKKVSALLKMSVANLNNNIGRMDKKGVFTMLPDQSTVVFPVLMVDIYKLGLVKISFVHDQQ